MTKDGPYSTFTHITFKFESINILKTLSIFELQRFLHWFMKTKTTIVVLFGNLIKQWICIFVIFLLSLSSFLRQPINVITLVSACKLMWIFRANLFVWEILFLRNLATPTQFSCTFYPIIGNPTNLLMFDTIQLYIRTICSKISLTIISFKSLFYSATTYTILN